MLKPIPDSIHAAPAGATRGVLLVDAQAPMRDIQALDVPLGLLRVKAGIDALYPDIQTRLIDWNTFERVDRDKAFLSILDDFRPGVVGLSAYSYRMPWAIRIATLVKEHDPGIPIVLGGHHASVHPEGLARHPLFDWYVVGEGHRSGPDLFRSILDGNGACRNVPSVAWRQDGRVHRTAASRVSSCMDDGPPVHWNDLDREMYRGRNFSQTGGFIYRFERGQLLPYVATQGCPYTCRFCERVGGSRSRFTSVDRVVEDISRMLDYFGGRHVFFFDNFIHLRRSWFHELMGAIEKRLDLDALCLVMADRLDRDMIDRMLAAGLRYLACFPESGSKRVRDLMDKPIRIDALMNNMRYASEQGAVVSGSFLLGWPGETREEAAATLQLASDSLFDVVMFNQLIYFHGAAIGTHLSERGIHSDSEEYFRHLLNPGEFCLADYSVKEYEEFYRKGRNLNRDKLASPGVIRKLSQMGMAMEYVEEQVSPDADRPFREGPCTSRLLSDRLGLDSQYEGIVVGDASIRLLEEKDSVVLLQAVAADGRTGEFLARPREDGSETLIHAGPFDFWYRSAGTMGEERLSDLIKRFASRVAPGEVEPGLSDSNSWNDDGDHARSDILGVISQSLGAGIDGDGASLGEDRIHLVQADEDEVVIRIDRPNGGTILIGVREHREGSPAYMSAGGYDLWYGERKGLSDSETRDAVRSIARLLEAET